MKWCLSIQSKDISSYLGNVHLFLKSKNVNDWLDNGIIGPAGGRISTLAKRPGLSTYSPKIAWKYKIVT